MVPSESHENGQKEAKRSRREDEEREDGGELKAERERGKSHEEKMNSLFPGAMETQSPSPPSHDIDMDTGQILRLLFQPALWISCRQQTDVYP